VASSDNTYSRFVSWLKILLPLLALAILSTLFLVSRSINPSQSIPYSDVDPNKLARDQGISSPNFSSITSDGSAITFSAARARPDPNHRQMVIAQDLVGKIETSSGSTIEIIAQEGLLDNKKQRATLTGNVKVSTPSGYRIQTNHVKANLDATRILAKEQVIAEGPMGNIVAGSMILTKPPNPNEPNDYVLVFKDGVKLVYVPEQ